MERWTADGQRGRRPLRVDRQVRCDRDYGSHPDEARHLCPRRLVDVWEAANRDDLFSVTSLKRYPYVANSDFHKPKHLYSWKTLIRSEKTWPAIKSVVRQHQRRLDALPQGRSIRRL